MTEQEEPFMTYALWGRADITPENAKSLLEEYVPDNVGTVYRPERITREEKGLRTALDWFESPDFLGEGGAVPSTNLLQSLLDDRDENGDDVYLLALWPADPSHEEFDFVESAQTHGIMVIDLARAWDELDLSLYSRPEPTKEEKAEAKEEVKRGRGRPRKLSQNTGEAQETAPAVEAPAETVATEETPEPAPVPAKTDLIPASKIHEQDMRNPEYALEFAKSNLMAAVDTYIEAKFAFMLAQSTAPTEDRPPFDPPYVGEHTKPYLWTKSSNTYRSAPPGTKPRRGEIVVNLTDEQASEKGIL